MTIEEALRDVSLLYVDTAPFIYYTESRAGFADKMRAVFAEVNAGQVQVLTCAVTLTETLMKPLENKDRILVQRYRALFMSTAGIRTVSVSPRAGDLAAELRATYGLKTPDALHIATAIDTGCDAFLANDTGIKRVSEITVLVLDDLKLEQSSDAD